MASAAFNPPQDLAEQYMISKSFLNLTIYGMMQQRVLGLEIKSNRIIAAKKI